MMLAVPLLICLLLVLINGLFVAAEFGLIGAPKPAIEELARQGEKRAREVHELLGQPELTDRYLITSQLGVTLASLGLGMYGENALEHGLAPLLSRLGISWLARPVAASVLAIALMTYLHVVLGEMLPKSLALAHRDRAALHMVRPMRGFSTVLYPLIWLLGLLTRGTLRLLGIQRGVDSSEHYHSTEELTELVAESEQQGVLRSEAGKLLRELFQFGDLTAAEVMVPRVRVSGIPIGARVEDLRDLLRSPHTRFPVYQGDLDHIVGMLHLKDLLQRVGQGVPIGTEGLRPVPLLPATLTLDEVLSTMHAEHTEMVVVLDEFGGTAGVVTREDLFKEVVGHIAEAGQRSELQPLPGGGVLASGTVRLEELGELLRRPLSHPQVDTVSGLVLDGLGRPAKVGDRVTYEGLDFEVREVDGRGVQSCLVTPAGETAERPEPEGTPG